MKQAGSIFVFILIVTLPRVSNAQLLKKIFQPSTKGTVTSRSYNGIGRIIQGNIGQEYGGGVGATSFFGELGGSDKSGSELIFLADLDILETRYMLSGFYRLNITPHYAIRTDLSLGRLSGSDARTENPYRQYRNLSFNSPLIEFNAQFEYNIFRFEFGRRRYNQSPYLVFGIGAFYFEPRAKINGINIKLRPLGTEGQGSAEYPDRKKYSPIQVNIPLGIGWKYNYHRTINFAAELAYRITFTDYIDDVSKTYVDPSILSEEAAQLADRSGEITDPSAEVLTDRQTIAGQQRGNPWSDDGYLVFQLRVSYVFKKGRRHAPKF